MSLRYFYEEVIAFGEVSQEEARQADLFKCADAGKWLRQLSPSALLIEDGEEAAVRRMEQAHDDFFDGRIEVGKLYHRAMLLAACGKYPNAEAQPPAPLLGVTMSEPVDPFSLCFAVPHGHHYVMTSNKWPDAPAWCGWCGLVSRNPHVTHPPDGPKRRKEYRDWMKSIGKELTIPLPYENGPLGNPLPEEDTSPDFPSWEDKYLTFGITRPAAENET